MVHKYVKIHCTVKMGTFYVNYTPPPIKLIKRKNPMKAQTKVTTTIAVK